MANYFFTFWGDILAIMYSPLVLHGMPVYMLLILFVVNIFVAFLQRNKTQSALILMQSLNS